MDGDLAGELSILTVCNPISDICYVNLQQSHRILSGISPFDRGLGYPGQCSGRK